MRDGAESEEAAMGNPAQPLPAEATMHDWSMSGPWKHEHEGAGLEPSCCCSGQEVY